MYQENQQDSIGSYGTTFGRKRKPKPFSVMLDIYPITDSDKDQTPKASLIKPQLVMDDSKKPSLPYVVRYPKFYGSHVQPSHAVQNHQPQASQEEERHQMIFHLNLYPKRKSKLTR